MRRLSGRSPVVQFAISSLVATVLIGLIVVAVSRHAGTAEAIRDAEQVTRLAGAGIVEPNVDEAVVAGDPAALRRLDAIVRRRVLDGREGIVRVKIWTADGRVVYSDERRLINARYPDKTAELAALGGDGVAAEVSDLSQPENRFERAERKLLEVYLPIQASDGQPLLFEAYQRFSSVSAGGRRLWLTFAPALLGGLLLLQLVNLPLVRSLAGRLRRGQQQREALLLRALDASQTERRAIAADLHDGVVQDLLGVSYSLAAQAQRVNGDGNGTAGAELASGAARTRDSVRALRSLLIDIYPPTLHQAGLAAALGDLATTFSARGLHTTVAIPAELDPGAASEQLLFRCAQETLRNACRHAGAGRASVWVRGDERHVAMEIEDDGCGFDDAVLADRPEAGHFGLRLLRDLVEDADGRLDVRSAAGSGTTVRVEVPR